MPSSITSRTRTALHAAPALLLAIVALWVARPATAEDQTITLESLQFQPANVTINVGDSVTWVHNDGSIPHTVTSSADDGAMFDQQMGDSSAAPFTVTFDEAGEFAYFCRIHPDAMTGTVTVLAQQASPTATSEPTTEPTSQPTATQTSQPTAQPTSAPNPPETGTGLAASAGGGMPWSSWLAAVFGFALAGSGSLVVRRAFTRR